MQSDPVRIRPYQPNDLDDLYRICLQTADNGDDATALSRDPRLPGEVYMAPYVTFEPSLAFVAQDAGGVAGYIVSARDSRAFEQRLKDDWWPALRARYPEPPPDVAEALPAPERYALQDIHHPWDTVDELAIRFPSHPHIDLVPRIQQRGIGRRLIETLAASLRDQGSPGLHLIVEDGNQKAVGFYRHVGFAEVPAEHRSHFHHGPARITIALAAPYGRGMYPEPHIVKIGGRALTVEDAGPGSGYPVLVHGAVAPGTCLPPWSGPRVAADSG